MSIETAPKGPHVRPWKMSVLTFACIYPLINLLSLVLFPFIGHWPLPLRTLLLSSILVPAMGALLGLLTARFRGWLSR